MIFRIDLKHFLTEAIDYFSMEDLISMEYCIISSKICNGSRSTHVGRFSELYPNTESIYQYELTGDIKVLEKMYFDMVDTNDRSKDRISNHYHNIMYRTFINPLLNHFNVMIVCDEAENPYVTVICEYLKQKFEIEVIDLNELFTKGKVGPLYIDRDKIRDKAVDIRRNAVKAEINSQKQTEGGRSKLLATMTKKEKVAELKKYGVDAKSYSVDELDEALDAEWVDKVKGIL